MKIDTAKTTDGYLKDNPLCGATVEEVFKHMMMSVIQTGEHCYADFNTRLMFSDESLDQAYLRVHGMPKNEYDELRMKERAEFLERQKNEEEYSKNLPELTIYLIEKGREVLHEKFWADWSKIVPIRLNDLYRGMELRSFIDVVNVYKTGHSIEEIEKTLYSQHHSGTSYGLVLALMDRFGYKLLSDYLRERNMRKSR